LMKLNTVIVYNQRMCMIQVQQLSREIIQGR